MFNNGNYQSVHEHISNIMSRGEDFKSESDDKVEAAKEQARKAQEFIGVRDDLMSQVREFQELKEELEREYDADLD